MRDEFLKRFINSVITSVGASALAVAHRRARRLRPHPLPLQVPLDANKDISFFFLSQLILPPVVLALPFLVLYKELALLDTTHRPDPALHADGAADRHLDHADQFDTIPIELDEAALVDGLSVWGTFFRIVLPIALPGMVAAFILSLVLCWNEYFFAALLTSSDAKTLPVMVASQTGSQGINWWVDGRALDRRDRAAGGHRHRARALHLIKGMTAGAVK